MAAVSKVFREQRGSSIDYLNGTDEVIVPMQIIPFGARVGIAGCAIDPGETGSLHVEGVFAMPKAEGAGAIMAGQEVQVDADGYVSPYGAAVGAAELDGPDGPDGPDGDKGSGDEPAASSPVRAGFAVAESAETDEDVLVKINA